jgi:hypothetical protein
MFIGTLWLGWLTPIWPTRGKTRVVFGDVGLEMSVDLVMPEAFVAVAAEYSA